MQKLKTGDQIKVVTEGKSFDCKFTDISDDTLTCLVGGERVAVSLNDIFSISAEQIDVRKTLGNTAAAVVIGVEIAYFLSALAFLAALASL